VRPVQIFSILVIYILLQFGWWSYLLIDLTNEVYENRIENSHLKNADPVTSKAEEQTLVKKLHQRRWMVVGEGLVFLLLLGWVSYRTFRSFRKEVELARMQKNFLLSVTHEFKSPLAAIKLYLQTIGKHDLDKERQLSFINKAIEDTERLDALVENTLLANMIDYKGYAFNKSAVNLSALLRLSVQKFNSLPDFQHKLMGEIEDSISLNGDKLALTLVINNLIENAAKYSPAGSQIKIHLAKSSQKIPSSIVLMISDEGQGIPKKEKQKIFQKFYRIGNEETRKTKGTGLGLYLVKYIVENHDGVISVEDKHPHGAIFKIEFKV